MKKILFAAFAATLLTAGCQKTEVILPEGPTEGSLMSFSTEMSKLTKSSDSKDKADADADGMYNLRTQEFKVWAYCDYEDTNTDAVELDHIYDGMAGLDIKYDRPANHEDTEGDKGTWKPEKEYYWPSAGKYLRFFAVSGVSKVSKDGVAIELQRSDDKTTASPKLKINNYIVTNTDPNTDLMVADFIRKDKSGDKRVTFNFRHALSKVQFQFKTEGSDADVYIQSLTVKDVKTVANLEVTENKESDKDSKPMKFTWDSPNSPKDFTDDCDVTSDEFSAIDIEKLDGQVDDDTAIKLTEEAQEFATWLVIPQDIVTKDTNGAITEGYKVEVIYVIGTRQFKAVFPLYTDTLVRWAENQYTKYVVTITPNKISFNASSTDWAPYDGDGDGKTGTQETPEEDDIKLQN